MGAPGCCGEWSYVRGTIWVGDVRCFLAFGFVLQVSGGVGGDVEIVEIVLEHLFFGGKRHPCPGQGAVYCGSFLFFPLPQGFDCFFFSC